MSKQLLDRLGTRRVHESPSPNVGRGQGWGAVVSCALLLALVSATLASCGVKSDLERTEPHIMLLPENSKDPSKPPIPLGQPGTPPPYTTGP